MSCFFLTACSSPSKSEKDDTGTATLIQPDVRILQTTEFTADDAFIGRRSETSTFIYGVIPIVYTGTQDLVYIEAEVSYLGKNGDLLFDDDTYLRQPHVTFTGSVNTNTFVTASMNESYCFIIVDLEDYGVEFSELASVELRLDGNEFSYAEPRGTIAVVGTPYRSDGSSTYTWNQDIRNAGDETVDVDFSRFVYENDAGQKYLWGYTTSFKQGSGTDVWEEDNIFGPGDTGRLSDELFNSDGSFTLSAALLSWDITTDTGVGKRLAGTAVTDPDEQQYTLQRIADQITRNARSIYQGR